RLAGAGHGVAEDGDAAGEVELDVVAGPRRGAADEVEGHPRLVGLRRSEGGAEAAAQDDAARLVLDRDVVVEHADVVDLDDVVLAGVVDRDALGVEADEVVPHGVAVAAGDLDAVEEIAGLRADRRGAGDGDGAAADAVVPGADADVVVLDEVPRGG